MNIPEDSYALVQFDDAELQVSDITSALAELDALNCGAILDFGNALNELSRTESLSIALKLAELNRMRFHKIGLISNGDSRGVTQIAEYARGRGLDVRTFKERDTATAWMLTANGLSQAPHR